MNLRSLQENVTEAIQALDNVGEFIDSKLGYEEGSQDSVIERIRPINYGDILHRMEFNGDAAAFAQVTVYKRQPISEGVPTTPDQSEGKVNLITGEMEAPEGWDFFPPSEDNEPEVATYSLRAVPAESSEETTIWATTSYWNAGINQIGWSDPYKIKGADGKDGRDGADGKDGIDGIPGEPGKDGKDGKDGADGMDGSVYEYIYYIGFVGTHKPNTPASGVGNDVDDYIPTETETVTVNGESYTLAWSDKARGVGEVVENHPPYMFEWRSERKKTSDGTWSDFSLPILWAKYGEKGKDGDGVQYIFTSTTEFNQPDDPTPDNWETNPDYQNNEADEYIPEGWSDNPTSVDVKNPYCWCAIRRYRNDKWQPYSEPTLWAEYVYLYHMELPQDEVKVPINDRGIVDSGFTVTIEPILYVNDDVQAQASFEYAFGDDEMPVSGWNPVRTFVASDFAGKSSYVWFKSVEHNLHKKCKITKEVNPVEVFIDKVVVKRELGDNLVNDSISLYVKKWDYINNLWVSVDGYKAQLKYRVVGETVEQNGEEKSCPAVFDLHQDRYYGINYIKFVIVDSEGNEKGFEEVGVITDGADGSSREVIYKAVSTEQELEAPTPEDWATNVNYQKDDYKPAGWTDDYPGVNSTTNRYVYVSERKRNATTGFKWGAFNEPHLYAKYTEVQVSDSEKEEIAATVRDAILSDVNTNIAEATGPIQSDLESTKQRLEEATTDLMEAITNGDTEAIKQAEAALAKANAAHTLAENASDGLTTLQTAVNNIGTENSSILSLNDLQLLSIAALGSDAATKDLFPGTDTEFADNVFAKNIVGLVGTFGEVKAEKLTGTTITGKTITNDNGTWMLNNDGSGKLANGNISWKADGTVTLSPNVEISWDSISDAVNDNFEGSGSDSGLTEGEVETIATRITKDTVTTSYINALDVTAKNISATEITGKNIKSSTNSWYINDSGSFQLGGSNGIKYNGSGNISLGSDVVISWDSISDAIDDNLDITVPDLDEYAKKSDLDDYATISSVSGHLNATQVQDLINNAGFVTEDEVGDIATSVGPTWLATTNVLAKNLLVNAANIEGTITAGAAKAANNAWYFNEDGTWKLGDALSYENGTVTWGDVKVKWGNVTDNNGNALDYEFDNGAFHTASGDIWTGSGDIYTKSGNIAAYDLKSTSDMRLKTPVKDINLTVDQIAGAPAFVFDWNETGKRSLGTSAQYWQEILPEGVGENPDGYLNMQYGNVALVALINLAKEVKELKAQVASLQDELKRR